MFENTPYDEQVWDLIASALQGQLSSEEELSFTQWLDASADNREAFDRLSHTWKEMEDYPVWAQADDAQAWTLFQHKLEARQAPQLLSRRAWMAAAAAVILIAGAGWWYLAGNSRTYATASGEQKTISLADGSIVTLQSQTRLRLAPGFNGKDRTVSLLSGTARFDVVHNAAKTFTVDMDAARVRDIGTSFTIQKTQDSILVSVSAGEVAFTQKASGRTREITAGGSLCLYTGASHRGEIRETASPSVAMDSLRFDDAPLSAVLATLEKRSGQSIRLTDTLMAQKRLTIKLGGESLEEALRLICASMHLDYTPQPGGYVLGRRDSARRK